MKAVLIITLLALTATILTFSLIPSMDTAQVRRVLDVVVQTVQKPNVPTVQVSVERALQQTQPVFLTATNSTAKSTNQTTNSTVKASSTASNTSSTSNAKCSSATLKVTNTQKAKVTVCKRAANATVAKKKKALKQKCKAATTRYNNAVSAKSAAC